MHRGLHHDMQASTDFADGHVASLGIGSAYILTGQTGLEIEISYAVKG